MMCFGATQTNKFYAARGVVNCGNYCYLCSEYGNMFLIADVTDDHAPVVVATEPANR